MPELYVENEEEEVNERHFSTYPEPASTDEMLENEKGLNISQQT